MDQGDQNKPGESLPPSEVSLGSFDPSRKIGQAAYAAPGELDEPKVSKQPEFKPTPEPQAPVDKPEQ